MYLLLLLLLHHVFILITARVVILLLVKVFTIGLFIFYLVHSTNLAGLITIL